MIGKKRSILILTQKVDANDGVLGFFHAWIAEFSKHYKSVMVICLFQGEYSLPSNVSVYSLGKERGVGRVRYLINFFTLIIRHRKMYKDVFVHMNQIYILLGAFIWRLLGKRVGLWYAHGHVSASLRIAVALAHTVFTSTEFGLRLRTKKKRIVGQGIDTERFSPASKAPSGRLEIITVSRLSPVKDIPVVIDALSVMKKSGIDAHLTVVGQGERDYQRYLDDFVSERGLTTAVDFVGEKTQRDLPKFLQSSDVFVNASRTGSLDKTMLEALSAGVPVITCNENLKSIFQDDKERYGPFMFPKGDTLALAERLTWYHGLDEAFVSSYKMNARSEITSRFSLPGLIERIASEYAKDSQ